MSEMERAKEIDEAVKAADARRRADAEEVAMAGTKLDKILDRLDGCGKAVDSLSHRMDAYEASAAGTGTEGDGEGEIEKDKPKELAADAEEIESYKAENGATHKIAADSVLAKIQTDAQRASDAWCKETPHPWEGESIVAYRRRAAKLHQQHSPAWKDVDLHTLSGQALRNPTAQIYADSIAASTSPASYPDTLVERINVDRATGQRTISFHGSPSAWTNQFKSGRQYVAKFRTGSGWRQE